MKYGMKKTKYINFFFSKIQFPPKLLCQGGSLPPNRCHVPNEKKNPFFIISCHIFLMTIFTKYQVCSFDRAYNRLFPHTI